MRTFRLVLAAVGAGTLLLVAAWLINSRRPRIETDRATPEQVTATGKCASCHRQETAAIVVEFERSRHAAVGTNCLDCHAPQPGQESFEHRGFTLARVVTAKNCASCHETEYQQFRRSRHAAAAYAAVLGSAPFSADQVAFAEQYDSGSVRRPANPLVAAEGEAAVQAGCLSCHEIGKPNADGSIGTCTVCHARHTSSVALAREPTTCGQCHMGPDHSQLEIYQESKHGVLFAAERSRMNLAADPKHLTPDDMPVPTCATCHMSGIGGLGVSHDVGRRESYYLFAASSRRRPGYRGARDAMESVCLICHTKAQSVKVFAAAESVVTATNAKVAQATALMDSLRRERLLTPNPLDEPIEFTYFDYWHYYGRTAKHGAFMGGADFVQWHGNYELYRGLIELRAQAAELRRRPGSGRAPAR